MHSAFRWLPVLLPCVLSACGGGTRQAVVSGRTAGTGNYAPPGPASDPWGPYIHQASARFDVPQSWIRAVIHQESGGREYFHGTPITSDAGAMGLMQVMPATYGELSARYGLGSDPYDPHDNIMAGTGYIRQLYERYGSPAFLAAYDAGPHRLDQYLAGRGQLPNETVNYLASAAPNLGREKPMTGPLASFAYGNAASRGPVLHDFERSPATGCWRDPNAAYDPDAPCRTSPPAAVQVAQAMPVAAPPPRRSSAAHAPSCWHDPDAAYDPSAPCQTPPAPAAPVLVAAAAAQPAFAPASVSAPASAPGARQAGCVQDPDAAYDPSAPCRRPSPVRTGEARLAPPMQMAQASLPPPVPYGQSRPMMQTPPAYVPPSYQVASAAPPPPRPPAPHAPYRYGGNFLISSAAASTMRPASGGGRWGIQVGAYANAEQARRMADSVRVLAPHELGSARAVLGTTAPFGRQVMYRSRLVGLSAESASAACANLKTYGQTCVTVPPGA